MACSARVFGAGSLMVEMPEGLVWKNVWSYQGLDHKLDHVPKN
jgi:hypothetical protein